MRSRPVAGRHLGWTEADLASKPWAPFWNPQMGELAPQAIAALNGGPLAEPLLPGFAESRAALFQATDLPENGFALCADGEMRLALETDMPEVTPVMIDWWFGWHSDSPERYKLWHPRAHVHAQWQVPPPEGTSGKTRYVDHISIVDEYLGSSLGRFAIAFRDPAGLGFTPDSLADDGNATLVLARTGLADLPFDVGYLAHHVRRTAGGSIMRSRFWIGGSHVAPRRWGLAGRAAAGLARTLMKPMEADARALIVHCAQEMAHLATFLPGLYGEFHDARS